jgi:hypothetical protein
VTLGGNKGPMFRPSRSTLDPICEQLNLRRCQLTPRIFGWHLQFGICGGDALYQHTGGQITGDDSALAVMFGKSAITSVKAKVIDALLLVWTVAGKAIVGKDRANVAIEIDRATTFDAIHNMASWWSAA